MIDDWCAQGNAAARRMNEALAVASNQHDQANAAKADLQRNNKANQWLSRGLRRWCQAINHTKVIHLSGDHPDTVQVNAMYARFKREESRCERLEATLGNA